jgi:hypothetical protein
MAIADENHKRSRLPLLLFIAAFVGVVVFSVAHKRNVDEPRDTVTQTAEAPSPNSEDRVIASAERTANVPSKSSAALQKPGPPDPAAERSAADSAARAADAAAALAASAGDGTN